MGAGNPCGYSDELGEQNQMVDYRSCQKCKKEARESACGQIFGDDGDDGLYGQTGKEELLSGDGLPVVTRDQLELQKRLSGTGVVENTWAAIIGSIDFQSLDNRELYKLLDKFPGNKMDHDWSTMYQMQIEGAENRAKIQDGIIKETASMAISVLLPTKGIINKVSRRLGVEDSYKKASELLAKKLVDKHIVRPVIEKALKESRRGNSNPEENLKEALSRVLENLGNQSIEEIQVKKESAR